MTNNFNEFQNIGREHLEASSTAATSLAKGLQAIAAETADYSKRSLARSSEYVEKLLGAKTFDDAIQTQSEYAKSSYASFFTQATKMGELFTGLTQEALKPVERMVSNVQGAAASAKVQATSTEFGGARAF